MTASVPAPSTMTRRNSFKFMRPWDQNQRRGLLAVASVSDIHRSQPDLVGIIGGIGPVADVRLAQLIVELDNKRCLTSTSGMMMDSNEHPWTSPNSGFTSDACHTSYLLYSNPRYIPNNNLASMGLGPSSVDALVDSSHVLAAAGANVIGMACTAAHTWREEVERRLNSMAQQKGSGIDLVEVLDLLDLTAAAVANDGHATVGLVEVDGTIQAKFFEEAMRQHGVEVMLPDVDDQMKIMGIVSSIKRGGDDIEILRHSMGEVVTGLTRKNTNITAIVFGCTDIAAIMGGYGDRSTNEKKAGGKHIQFYDTLQVLAEEIVRISN